MLLVFYVVVKSSYCVHLVSVADDLNVVAWVFDGVDVGVMRSTPASLTSLASSLSATLLSASLLSAPLLSASLLSRLISSYTLNSTGSFVGLGDFLGSSSIVVRHMDTLSPNVIVTSLDIHHVLWKVIVEDQVHGKTSGPGTTGPSLGWGTPGGTFWWRTLLFGFLRLLLRGRGLLLGLWSFPLLGGLGRLLLGGG